jgi:hypothetical protein
MVITLCTCLHKYSARFTFTITSFVDYALHVSQLNC